MTSFLYAVRRSAGFTVVFFLLAGLGSAQTAELRSGFYEVEPATIVEMEGGYLGLTYEMNFGGSLQLEVDSVTGTGSILGSDLWLFSEDLGGVPFPFPTQGYLPLEELVGTLLNNSTLDLVSPSDGSYPYQTASLVLTASAEGVVLNGFYDEGCCDRYVLTFEDVPFRMLPGPTAMAVPSTGSAGSAILILVLGIAGAVLIRRLL